VAGKRANAPDHKGCDVSNESPAPDASDDDLPGERIGDVVDRIRSRREAAEERGTGESKGVIADQLEIVEERLLSFARALGGDVDEVADLPFTEEAAQDEMPSALYVRHDEILLNQVTSWLLQDQHIGLVSPYGTGKTAFREVALRDLRAHEDFVVAHVENPRDTTPRQLYGEVLRAAYDTGFELDTEQFTQARDGIPWATDEARQAVRIMAEEIRAEGKRPILIVDEIEVLPEELLSPLQTAGDAGVRLFLLGTPEGKERVANLRGTLDSRLRYYEGIEHFDADAVEEYVERSMAYVRGEVYEGQGQDLFTQEAIEDVAQRSEGNAREVRIECRELFTRAAFVWDKTGQSIDRIQVTPQLRHRRFGMDS
jgi:Cdc6-like AAA superfamily ATPase